MKRFKTLLFSVAGVILCGCSALDLAPTDNYSLDNYWNTLPQCERFIIGLHLRMKNQQENFLLMGEMRDGLFKTGTSTSVGQNAYNVPIVSNNLTATNYGIAKWGDFYRDIYQINHAIDMVSHECAFLTDAQRNTFLGQLYGIRAYYYFHLFRTWGGVPLCDEPDILKTQDFNKLDKPRSTEAQIYQFIRDDVDRSYACYSSLPFEKYKSSFVYWNKAATCCLLAEVYLWGAKVKPIGGANVYSTTIDADMTKVISVLEAAKATVSPMSNFANVFKDKTATNTEMIFALYFGVGESSNDFGLFTYPTATFTGYTDANGTDLVDPIQAGGGALRYEWKFPFFESFANTDTRKKATFYDFYKKDPITQEQIKGVFLNKFIGVINAGVRVYCDNYPIYRYMDAVLMLAEAECMKGNGAAVKGYIEDVRRRAYGAGFPTFTYTTQEAAEEAILAERQKEFVAEGKCWYDTRRMLGGEIAKALVQNGDERLVLWPVDPNTLSTDANVKQTDGY